MNSPPDPSSPSPSTPSSGSPPPEEAFPSGSSGQPAYLVNPTTHVGSAFSASNASSAKRRLPAGSSYASGSARDPKSRRRGESGRAGTSEWQGVLKEGGGKKEKDELIDTALVDYLRKEIGDPFLEPGFKG